MTDIVVGDKFGAWEVLRRVSDGRYLCVCTSCNETQKRVKAHDLRSGKSLQCKSCSHSVKKSHGAELQYPSEYQSWQSMIARCTNPNNKDYPRYGGRGITVDLMWLSSFEAFLMMMGRKPTPEHTIDRIDGTKGYMPGNCRWATRDEQNRNLSSNIPLTIDGETKVVTEWARDPRCTVSEFTLYKRIARGWTDAKKIVFTPSRRSAEVSGEESREAGSDSRDSGSPEEEEEQ